jgi:hypothetical protein
VKAAREAWFEAQPELDPKHLVFVDESGLSTKMARLRGWAPRGQRCRAAIPHGHWKTTTFVGGLTLCGICAPMLLDGPMDGEAFLAWCEQMLCPALGAGRRRHHGQSAGPQGRRHTRSHRSRRRDLALSAALQPRLQSHRERIRQAQGARAKDCRSNCQNIGNRRGQRPLHIQTRRMRELLRPRRLRLALTGICSRFRTY